MKENRASFQNAKPVNDSKEGSGGNRRWKK